MGDDLVAFGVAKTKAYGLVDSGDARAQGLLTMTDARWNATVDFLRSAGLAKPGVDYRRAWTLDVVRDVKVLP
jgi:NitT/TauT family transport system substrate-binding protein